MTTTKPLNTSWYKWSSIFTRSEFEEGNYKLRVDVNNRRVAAHANFSCPILIDLTETYGDNIPSKEVLDSKPYFEGSVISKEW